MINLTNYKVIALKYPNGEYRLSKPAEVVDEGSFYRIEGIHIFDKFKIQSMNQNDNKLTIIMTDKVVTLEIQE